MKEKNIINFYMRTITPVHIGASSEQHLAKGVDYIAKNGTIYILNEKKILKTPHGTGIYELYQYTNSLSKGKLDELLKGDLKNYSSKIIDSVCGEIGTDIKINIKNTMDGKPYIPGTSLKGAIRSVIFNKVKKPHDKQEQWTFGKIQEDPFRYLIVGDTFFDESLYINTKTFNLFKDEQEWQGGWKHNLRGQNTREFKPSGFTFPYECISPDSYAQCQIIFNKNSYEIAKNRGTIKVLNFFNQFSVSDSQKFLFETIQEYTRKYIEKEIEFFEKYSNNETHRIIEEYKRLLELNKKAPVLRIGQGSGFHSITGDHMFESHIAPIEENHNRKYKSRKLAFNKEKGEFKFYPMGFVQLLLPEQVQDKLEQIEQERKERVFRTEKQRKEREIQEAKAKKEAEDRAKADKLATEEAKRPQFSKYPNLNPKKRYDMEAVVSFSGYPNKINVYVKDGYIENDLKLDSYSSPLDIGKVLIVTVSVSKKGKAIQASFKKFKNNQ